VITSPFATVISGIMQVKLTLKAATVFSLIGVGEVDKSVNSKLSSVLQRRPHVA
jgi:hypothetical protein